MLEGWAWHYIMLPEGYLWLVSFGFLVLGGVMAAVAHRGTAILERAPYFARTAIVAFLQAVGQGIWLQAGQAMLDGWLSVLVGLEATFGFAVGYAIVALGQARSRDVLGHGRAGILSLVPIVNLWLLFAKGQDRPSQDTERTSLGGGLGIAFGLVLIAASRIIAAQLGPMAEARVLAVSSDPANAAAFADLRLRHSSLSEVLREIASETFVPVDAGGGVTLIAVEANGPVLRFVYSVPGARPADRSGVAEQIRSSVCADPMLGRLLAAGALVELRYQWLGGTDSDYSVKLDDCGV